jgi:hypothetical protein
MNYQLRINGYAATPAPRNSRGASGARTSGAGWRCAASVVLALVLAVVVMSTVAHHVIDDESQQGDAALVQHLLAHETKFNQLAGMLGSDCRNVRPMSDPVDLARLGTLMSEARMQTYRALLRETSIADLRCLPLSGELILVPGLRPTDKHGARRAYKYRADNRSQSAAGTTRDYWRGSGMLYLTRDRWIRGNWFLQDAAAINVAFSPY